MSGKTSPETPESPDRERIAKRIARSGLCSRRDAEKLIADGRVAVNRKTLDSPAVTVGPDDVVTVDGKPLPEVEPTRLWLYHKPAGLVTTNRDPQGRPTVFEKLPKDLPRVISVGRLDINTEGLLLLTNDGGLARALELPSTGWLRRYRVRAHGTISQDRLDALKQGISVEGVHYGPIEALLDRSQGGNVWLTMALREGKNREIKNVLETLGLRVNRLIRVSFGPFMLRDIASGMVEEVKPRVLRDQLGAKMVREAGLKLPEPTKSAAPQRGQGAQDPGKGPGKTRDKSRPPRARRGAGPDAGPGSGPGSGPGGGPGGSRGGNRGAKPGSQKSAARPARGNNARRRRPV